MPVGFPTKVNYATGDVLSATNMNDLSGTVNLLESAQYAAGKNKIINGDFGVWQRGTTFTNTIQVYCADRWFGEPSGANTTYSQQTFTPGTAPVAGYEGQFFLRIAAATADDNWGVDQRIEDVRTFAGQTITISFWAKTDSTRTLNVYTSQNFGSGGSASVATAQDTKTLSTSWQRFTSTVAIASIAGKTIGTSSFLQILFRHPVNSTGQFDIWGVQVEAGSTASPFQTATGTKQGELAACQRYYTRFNASTSGAYAVFAAAGMTASTTQSINYTNLPVELRTYPSSVDFGGTILVNSTATSQTVTGVALQDRTNTKIISCTFTVASGLTANQYSYVRAENSSTAYLGFSAEL